jgi:hypothetical protein
LISTGKSALVWDIAALRQPTETKEVDEAKCAELYADLSRVSKPAYEAVIRLADSPDAAIKLFERKIAPIPVGGLKAIDTLLPKLDDADYDVREKATRDLINLGPIALDAIKQFLATNPPAEARQRAERVLARMDVSSRLEDRVLETLERIGSEPAKQLLRKWAAGDPDANLTKQAQAGLDRLDRRKW